MPLASGAVPTQYMTLPGGNEGTDQTVSIMSGLTMGPYGARSPKVRALAINILNAAGVQGKDYENEMIAIHNWVRDTIRYTRDVAGQETLCPPEEILFNTKAGDCDDMAMAEAALLAAVGFDTRFKVIGVTPDRYSHVYLQAKLAGIGDGTGSGQDEWVSLDPIMKNWSAGQEAPAHMVKISKVYPENTTGDLTMSRQINGLGYIADQRVVSHLSPDPTEEYVPGSGSQSDSGPGNYVTVDSMLDSDLPIEALSNNAPAFAQNAHYDDMQQAHPARTTQRRPRLYYQNGAPAENWVYDKIQADADASNGAMDDAGNPIQGLHTSLMGPEALANLAGGTGRGGRQAPVTNAQRPALVQTPEGIDAMFSRQAQVMNGPAGDRILYQGLTSLAERPPIRPVNSVAGLGGVFGVTSRRAPMMGGLGVLGGRSMSGPGIGDLSDLADDTATTVAPTAVTPVPLAATPPVAGISKSLLVVGGLALLAAWYFAKKKSGGSSGSGSGSRRRSYRGRSGGRSSGAALKDDFLLNY